MSQKPQQRPCLLRFLAFFSLDCDQPLPCLLDCLELAFKALFQGLLPRLRLFSCLCQMSLCQSIDIALLAVRSSIRIVSQSCIVVAYLLSINDIRKMTNLKLSVTVTPVASMLSQIVFSQSKNLSRVLVSRLCCRAQYSRCSAIYCYRLARRSIQIRRCQSFCLLDFSLLVRQPRISSETIKSRALAASSCLRSSTSLLDVNDMVQVLVVVGDSGSRATTRSQSPRFRRIACALST